jgi:hypothetical protein
MSGGFKKVALGVALSTSNAIKAAGDALGSPEVRKTVGAVASGTAMVLATGCHGGGGAPEKVNHAPKITDGVFNNGGVPFNSTKSINLSTTLHASDEDGDVVSYRINRIISGEANGTATISGSSLTFVPATGVEGSQVIEIIAVDDRGAVSAPRTLTISEIDTKAPEVSDPIPDTTSPTNHDVTVLITSNETDDITSTSTDWIRVGASGNWTFSKTYTTNITNDLFIAQDRAGNTTTKSVSITNIIKNTPEVEDAVYSTTAPTNQDVVVTFKSLQDLVTPTGYTKTFDNAYRKFLFTKAYSENTNETITFFDVAGNKAEKTVSITNLDKTAPGVITFDADTTNTSILTHVVVNESGKGYLWIPGYTPGNQPTVQDIIDHATQDSSVLTLTKDQVASYLRSGLFAATSYVTYLVTEDGLGNKSNITIKSFTTLEDPDSPSNVLAPNMTATTNTIHMSNNITDADGVRNVVFYLYSNASGTSLVSQNSTGDFSSLASNADFWGKTTAETYNKTSRTWTPRVSPLASVKTDIIIDTTPDVYVLTDVTSASRSTVYTSNVVVVSGINTATNISISGGTYSINGGAWTSAAGTVNNGDSVQVRLASSANFNTKTTATLNIGGVVEAYEVTTLAQDIIPDAFDIANMTNQALNSVVTTNTVTIAGMNDIATASTTVGTLVKNGTDTGLTSTTVTNGDTLAVKLTTSANPGTAVNGTITVGTFTDAFSVTTVGPDTTPDVFTLTDVGGATRSIVYTSNTITVAGINTAAPISITGGEYAINGGAWTTVAGIVNNNDTVQVRQTSSASFNTKTTAALNIGGVTEVFEVTTLAQDITPDAFDITNMSSQALNTVVTTNTVTIAGMNDTATASTTVGTLVKNGTDTGLTSTAVTNGDTLAIKVTTSGTPSAVINGSLSVGTFSDNFSITNVGPDTTPDAFVFTDVTGATKSTQYISSSLTIAGLNTAAPIAVTGGEYRING